LICKKNTEAAKKKVAFVNRAYQVDALRLAYPSCAEDFIIITTSRSIKSKLSSQAAECILLSEILHISGRDFLRVLFSISQLEYLLCSKFHEWVSINANKFVAPVNLSKSLFVFSKLRSEGSRVESEGLAYYFMGESDLFSYIRRSLPVRIVDITVNGLKLEDFRGFEVVRKTNETLTRAILDIELNLKFGEAKRLNFAYISQPIFDLKLMSSPAFYLTIKSLKRKYGVKSISIKFHPRESFFNKIVTVICITRCGIFPRFVSRNLLNKTAHYFGFNSTLLDYLERAGYQTLRYEFK
jgi:hypothetical protein